MRFVAFALLVCACRRSDVVPDTEPLVAPSSELPGWFGRRDVPARRISGRLLDGDAHPLVGIVHLRIDAPDATVWRGLDVTTARDGRFDFGELRAGAYSVLATTDGRTSRVVPADTSEGDAELDVFAFPCTPDPMIVRTHGGTPIANARVDIGGVIIATTDHDGRFSLCSNSDELVSHVHARGFAAERVVARQNRRTDRPHEIELLPAISVRGRVLGVRGPQAGVAIHPVFIEHHRTSHGGSRYDNIPVQVVTGDDGRFVLREVPEIDAVGDVSEFTFEVLQGASVFRSRAMISARSHEEVVLDTAPTKDPMPYPEMRLIESIVSGVITHDGRPVADAEVSRMESNIGRTDSTRSRGDGRFDLRVHELTFGKDDESEPRTIDLDLRVDHASGLHGRKTVVLEKHARGEALTIELEP